MKDNRHLMPKKKITKVQIVFGIALGVLVATLIVTIVLAMNLYGYTLQKLLEHPLVQFLLVAIGGTTIVVLTSIYKSKLKGDTSLVSGTKKVESEKGFNPIQKIKNGDRTNLILTLTTLFITILIIIIGAWNYDFDIVKAIQDTDFIKKIALMYILAFVGLFIGIFQSDYYNENRKNGAFYETREEFRHSKDNMSKRGLNVLFSDYVDYKYDDEKRKYISQILSYFQILDIAILELTDKQLLELKSLPLPIIEINGTNHHFEILTEEQYREIMKIKRGDFYFPKIGVNQFLSERNVSNEYLAFDLSEPRKKRLYILNVVSKLVSIIVIPIIAISFAQSDKTLTMEQIVMRVLQYLGSYYGALSSGFFVSFDKYNITREQFAYKNQIITDCMSDYDIGIFKPKTDEQLTINLEKKRAELLETMKKEEEHKKEIELEKIRAREKIKEDKLNKKRKETNVEIEKKEVKPIQKPKIEDNIIEELPL